MVDVVDVVAGIQKMVGAGDSLQQKQNSLSVSDVWHLWDLLVAKYDVMEIMHVLMNFAKDDDLRAVVAQTLKLIEKSAAELEHLMLDFGINPPSRPPLGANSTINMEAVTDRYIFDRIFQMLKDMLVLLISGFNNSTSPVIIKLMKKYIIEKMTMVDNLSVYGELKGYLTAFPMYLP